MRIKLLGSLTALVAGLFLTACETGQDNSGRAIKMQRSSGKMNREVDAAYFAVCTTVSSDGHSSGWSGPHRTDKEHAMRDANDHNKEYPGHNAIIDRH